MGHHLSRRKSSSKRRTVTMPNSSKAPESCSHASTTEKARATTPASTSQRAKGREDEDVVARLLEEVIV